ncbi:MAG: excinuclease ABC subunit UvrA [Planctomycetia bacterium]|nr:excinuclease ABC subunit UvrA [Planctomycetia bacterium]
MTHSNHTDAHNHDADMIHVRGVRTHNLQNVDVDLPHRNLIAFCGPSGSGKSSLALDVLYTEGRRRFLECFSAQARLRMEKFEKPDYDTIDGLPPSLAVTSLSEPHSAHATVGMATETLDYLRLLFAQASVPHCLYCGQPLRHDEPEEIVRALNTLPDGTRAVICFAPPESSLKKISVADFENHWRTEGYSRVIIGGKTFDLNDPKGVSAETFRLAQFMHVSASLDTTEELALQSGLRKSERSDGEHANNSEEGAAQLDAARNQSILLLTPDQNPCQLVKEYLASRHDLNQVVSAPMFLIVVARVVIGKTDERQLRDHVINAYATGNCRCHILIEGNHTPQVTPDMPARRKGLPMQVDEKLWNVVTYSKMLRCEDCGFDFPSLEPKLFNYASPAGACSICGGLGLIAALDINRIVPNFARSIRQNAIAPWDNKTYRSYLMEFLERAQQLGVRDDVPFASLTHEELNILYRGNSELKFPGLNGFFTSLIAQKYKMNIRVFLSRWIRNEECPMCQGSRLNEAALCAKIDGVNICDVSSTSADHALEIINSWKFNELQRQRCSVPLTQIKTRLEYLQKLGLGHLALDRPLHTLSTGEQRRVDLTRAFASNLVNMLYVLDEPSIGLHPQDVKRLQRSLTDLRDRGNTVIVVDHNPEILKGADKIVEFGPGAGSYGGKIVFTGSVEQLEKNENSLTGSYLTGKRSGGATPNRRKPRGYANLYGASGHNLQNLNVSFPLGVLTLVTGVSGAGKTSLTLETLYPAIRAKLNLDLDVETEALHYDKLHFSLKSIAEESVSTSDVDARTIAQAKAYRPISQALVLDQTPIGRSSRSNPVTYLKIFDEIRALYADTPEAKAHGYTAGYFSFNVGEPKKERSKEADSAETPKKTLFGRCRVCKGEGYVQTDMGFLADVNAPCPICNGKRYKSEALDVLYYGLNIAETLDLTVREAFSFFRKAPKIQHKLQKLIDVGLDYLRLGQPSNTLSGGEAQRLKLASFLATTKRNDALFILDEPTAGLHFVDVVKLLDCLNTLVESGASVIVVDHNPLLMRAADYIIDLGPGCAQDGGRIVAQGTPEQVAASHDSVTAKHIAATLRTKTEE